MSFDNLHQTSCNEVMHALFLYIDHEIEAEDDVEAIELHFRQCPPCAAQAEQEALLNRQLKALLNRSCQERASDRLRNNVSALVRQQYVQWSQSITYTEITTDSFTQTRVEIHEVYESDDE